MGIDKKTYWDRRARKIQRRGKRRSGHNSSRNGNVDAVPQNKKKILAKEQQYSQAIKLPSIFSFETALEDTVDFYNRMLGTLKSASFGAGFLIDAEDVLRVSTDAIMYLIAIMKNYKISRKKFYSFIGNYPIDTEAKDVFTESGFLKFVKSKEKNLPKNSEKKAIISGKRNDAPVAGNFCQFVCDKLGVEKTYTARLYEVIVEMMSNVVYHAYKDDDEMTPEWYMYAEYTGEEIKFLFLDTGVGIAKTVKKHSLYERVISRIGVGSESKLIKSALDGEFRTQTEKENHGKGMPYISAFAAEDMVKKFQIISGKGHCWMDHQNKMKFEDMNSKLYGTIYSFSLVKTEEEMNK